MAVAISAAFILPDLPQNSRGFTEEELLVAQLRMTEDVGEVDEDDPNQGAFDGLFMALKDVKIYLMMLTFTAYVVGLSFNAFFVSTVPTFYLLILSYLNHYSPRMTTLGFFFSLFSPIYLMANLCDLLAHTHRDSRLQLCPNITHELASVGIVMHSLAHQCLACRSHSGKGKSSLAKPGCAVNANIAHLT